jgi:RHS repeat-associated protein
MIYKNFLRKGWLTVLSLLGIISMAQSQTWNPGHKAGTITGIYNFSYNLVPDQLVELFAAGIPNTGLTYQWEQSTMPVTGFVNIAGATQTSYTFLAPLTQTTYYRRKTTNNLSQFIYSNVIKISVVSVNWEDLNYIREHDVLTTNITTWTAVDQLPIGQKLQTTTYLDGLGRGTEKISRETATPATATGVWGDMVQFSQYDPYGREAKRYLPYTTTTQSGKYKTAPDIEQTQYYATNYNEPTSAYSTITFDNSPLNRVVNVKQPGTAWAAAAGNSAVYDVNTLADNVQSFTVDYIQGNPPVYKGVYPAGTLYKMTYKDENQKQVVEFTNKSGQLILKAVQLADDVSALPPGGGGSGAWICTYSIYDDFGLLRYQIQPEGVKYLAANSWSFAGANGLLILNEQCFQYNYDDKGRTIWKKAPGAQPLQMLYDIRDRVVFMQDGNQALLSPPQWTANIYDELDRPVITTLYNTAKTIAQLQTDINTAAVSSTVTITNPAQPIAILTVNQRQAGIPSYKATNTVYLIADAGGEFESLPGDEFTAEIDAAAGSAPVNVTATVLQNPVSSADLNNTAVCTVLKYMFYDDYSFTQVKSFDNSFTNTTAYSTTDPNVQPIAKTNRTTSMPTGSMTRVLGTTLFLSATHYYDERGSHIQTQEDNIKSGTDVTTLQYHFDGRMLSSCNNHSAAGGGYENFKTLTKYIFDKLGRATSIQKQFGSNAFKTISSYDYDDAGRVKTKHLDPGYTAGGGPDLESLNYSYNIHNQLTGINKDYALKTSGTYNKWGHFFGMYLGFDNRDNVFANANLLGQVTGQLWSTQGDDAQRKYDYTYDNAGRLVSAAFNEKLHTGDSWSNAAADFSVNGTNGKITYDLNGNLLNMLQKGVLPGAAAPITVDNLSYTYASLSNKLQSVTDNMTNTTANGSFGDFKDGTNGVTPDYVYDANGNIVIDLNKNVKGLPPSPSGEGPGVRYNFLDKPEEIRIAGKGTIKIVYSADGEKLQRKFTSETEDKIKITTYINQFIYEETTTIAGAVITPFSVSSINFEEGRIRIITPTTQSNGLDALTVAGNITLPNTPLGDGGVYDYFVMDYQQNVRMILTEEIHSASNTATMETNRTVLEESIFGQTGANNEVATTRFAKPAGWTSNTSSSVSRVGTTSGHNIGPNTLQKVMAGDKISTTVQYYYQAAPGGNNTSFVNTVLSSLTTAITGGNAAGGIVKGNAAQVSTQLSGMGGFVNAVQPNGSNPTSTTPQAFLTILFFDERFNFIAAADGGVAQQQVSSSFVPLTLTDVKAPKNGYAYIYVSNQSNSDVYFDNLVATIVQGNIAEENHYYAYGLKIATLSSRKFSNTPLGDGGKNNYLYQGAFSELDEDIGWNDFMLRNYDVQIGRWVQQDPFQQFASPYVGMGADPINNTDPSGGIVIDPIKTLETVVVTASRAKPVTQGISVLSGLSNVTKLAGWAVKVSGAINTSISTAQAGSQGVGGGGGQQIESEGGCCGGIVDGVVNFGTNLIKLLEPVSINGVKEEFDQRAREIGRTNATLEVFGIISIDQAKQEMEAVSKMSQREKTAYWTEYTLSVGLAVVPIKMVAGKPKSGSPPKIKPRVVINTNKGNAAVVGVTRGSSIGIKAANGGSNIALGVSEYLSKFAEQVKGLTWETWGAKNFQSQFLETINNSANKIHFNLDGIPSPWGAVAEGAKGFPFSRITSWELFQLYSNPAALQRTIFYQGGKIAPNPFH